MYQHMPKQPKRTPTVAAKSLILIILVIIIYKSKNRKARSSCSSAGQPTDFMKLTICWICGPTPPADTFSPKW